MYTFFLSAAEENHNKKVFSSENRVKIWAHLSFTAYMATNSTVLEGSISLLPQH